MRDKVIICEELTQARKVWGWLSILSIILSIIYPISLLLTQDEETGTVISITAFFLFFLAISVFMYFISKKYKLEITEEAMYITTFIGCKTIPFSKIESFRYTTRSVDKQQYVFVFTASNKKTLSLVIYHPDEMIELLNKLNINQIQ